jgi:hypothetical protein
MLKTMMNNGKRKGTLLLLIFLCCTAALLVDFQSVNAKSTVGNGLNSSLKSLIDLGKEATVSSSPLRLVLKWQGPISGYNDDPSVEVAKLSARLGLSVPSGTEEDGHMTYRAETTKAYETRLSLFWSELGEGNSYVIVTLDTANLQNEDSFQAVAGEVSAILEQNKINAEWNVSLQGITDKQGAPEEILSQTELLIDEQFEVVTPKESYSDVATVSRTYSIPGLKRSVVSGNDVVSAQIAVHHEDLKGENRLTIGFPLITIEY